MIEFNQYKKVDLDLDLATNYTFIKLLQDDSDDKTYLDIYIDEKEFHYFRIKVSDKSLKKLLDVIDIYLLSKKN